MEKNYSNVFGNQIKIILQYTILTMVIICFHVWIKRVTQKALQEKTQKDFVSSTGDQSVYIQIKLGDII